MSWSGATAVVGGALWSGNPPIVTTAQLISTVSSLSITGDTSTWANYPAITTVNLQNFDIISTNNLVASNINAQQVTTKFLSTLDLQISTINGSEFIINGDTAIIGGVTIANSSMTVINMKLSDNGTGTGKSGGTIVETATNAIGAVANTVFQAQSAVSGLLSGTGSVLMQTYYGVAAAGAAVDLINKTVTLATNAQALYDSRQQNFIAGPGGPPGQTSYVYETINGTTQFQFSTLGSPVTSVYRTTDQQFPNQTFGREIFTSSIIPAGSKVVRSVSDPYQFPIISTQLLSTTNYLQSFGQWHSIIEPDYNLFVSTLTANNVSTNQLSVAQAWISSVNGVNSAVFLNPTTISTGQVTTSSIIVTSGLVFSTAAGYDITRTTVSTTGTYDSVSSVTQNFLNYQMTLTATGTSFDMGWLYQITTANESFWSHKQFSFNQPFTSDKFGVIDITYGSYTNGDYFDIKNLTTAGNSVLVYNSVESNYLLFIVAPGTFYRVTYSSGTNSWTYAANPTQTAQTTVNSFNIAQGWDNTILSTNNNLTINAATTAFPGIVTAQTALTTDLIAEYAYVSTLQVQNASISSLLISTSYTQNIIDNYLSTTTGIFDIINVSSFYSGFGSISSANVSSLTTNGITFTSLPNKPYDLTNTFTSTVAGDYDAVSTLTQNILNYNLSANLTGESIIYLDASFTCQNNDNSWASQFMIAKGFSEVFLYTANATNFFDIQNQGTQIVTVYLSINGSLTTFLRLTPGTPIYRVTATVTAGVTVWTYALSPGVVTPSFVQNNLTISQDLQNVFFSTLNTLQFNAGDIYMNGPLEATTAIFNNTTIQQAFISSISTGSISLGNLSLVSLTTTNNISSYNQVAIIQTDGNAQTVQPLEIYTNYTTVGEPSYGYYSPFRTYDNLSTVNMLTSQMKYNVYDGYVNVGLGSVSNITFDTNYDLYINNVYLGRPGNKASLGFTSIPYNGGFGSFSGAMIRIQSTLPNPPGTALNAFSVTLSNSGGGSDYVHLYGAGWNSGQVNTDIYMPTYSTGNPAIMYNQAGSNTISILDASPGTPFPNTTQTSIPNDTVSITHVPGGALSSIIQIASPILNLNSQLYWGSNTKRISMFSMRMVAFLISKTAPGGQAYGFADVGGFVTDVNGNRFKTSEYTVNCTFGQVNCESQRTLALNSCSLTTENSGGYWFVHCYATTPTIPAVSTGGNDVVWVVNVIAMPVELASFQNYQPSQNVGDVIPSSIGAFELQAQLIALDSHLSSITASTLTIKAFENIAILGNLDPPVFLGTGDVAINANSNIDLMANYDIIMGAGREIDMTAASTIRFTSPEIRAHGFTTVKIPGTTSIPAVSALALTNGNDYAGSQNKSQIEFQFYGGGFNHYISSRHDANVTYSSGNAIDFWLYSVTTGGNAQTASSAPGTGNVNVMSLTASNVVINRPIQISDALTGGTGTLTVDNSNHLYWNGNLIA